MICPNCGTTYKCPCKSCHPDTLSTKFSFEEDGIKCLTCGICRDESWWMDEEVRQLCEQYNVNSLTEVVDILSKAKENDPG